MGGENGPGGSRGRTRTRLTYDAGSWPPGTPAALKVRDDVPSLRRAKLVHEVERSFAKACDRGDFRLVHYSIQGDHVHLIVEAHGFDALGRGMKSLGARLARAVNRVFSRTGPVLKDRYHHVVLKTPTQVRNALRYVLLNGQKHARRRDAVVRIDPASSGRWFEGWKRTARNRDLLAEARGRLGGHLRAIADPHTWLLSTGWRKAGPAFDPTEIPAS